MKTSGNTILVTGGGSGIGAGLARRWHDAGNTVIVAGRRVEALESVVAGRDRMHPRALNVDDAAAVDAFATTLIADFPALNVLVNNAGVMRLEPIDTRRDLRDAEETITTNLLGPIRLTNALIDHLAARSDAAVVNVTSGLAFVPMVDAAIYSATKAAMHSYTVSLRYTLQGRVEVIELAPPAVQTDLTPGQADRPGYMPLDAYLNEVLPLFAQSPPLAEIVVDRARGLRDAEAEGRFEATVTQLNDFARAARAQNG